MKNNIYIAIIIILFSFSCKKKEFPVVVNPSSSDYIFRVEGQIGEEDISFAGGNDGYVLNTDYQLVSENNYILNATFAENDCLDCFPRLKISMNTNSGKYHDTEFDMSDFTSGVYEFQPCTVAIDRIVLSDELSSHDVVNNVIVNGFYAGINEYEIVDAENPVETSYQYQGQETTINNNHWFLFSNECGETEHSVDVFPINYSATTGQINITPPVFDFPGLYSWLLSYNLNGEVILDTLVQPSSSISEVNFSVAEVVDQIDEFFLTMVYSGYDGNMIIERQNSIPSTTDFIVPSIPIEVFDVQQSTAPTFEIEYFDEEGNRFITSENCLNFSDNIENIFTVLSFDDYEENSLGMATAKLEFSTSCTLINTETMETIELDEFHGTIALPVPEF